MNIAEIKQFGEVEAIKLGFGPIGPLLMSVYLYILDGIVIDTGQRHATAKIHKKSTMLKLCFLCL
jgi:hypothetical protein